MRAHEKLEAWKLSMQLVKKIYELTKQFPKEELFCLTQQIRIAAISIPSNIAEGSGRSSTKEYAHFISIARGSLSEVETQIQIAQMLNYTNDTHNITATASHVERLLTGLHKKWRTP
jgi:four helix bundle protein